MKEIIKIDNLNMEELKIFSSYNEPELFHFNEPNPGIFIAETPNVVRRALDAGYKPISILCEEKYLEKKEDAGILDEVDVPVFVGTIDVLMNLTGYKLTRGFLCAMERRRLLSVDEMLEELAEGSKGSSCSEYKGARRIAIIDQVMNPTNVGAIFRSAAAMGMDGVILTKGSTDPLYRRAARVAMGTVFQVPWTANVSFETCIEKMHELGFKVAALALSEDSIWLDDEVLKNEEKLALVLGTEGDGISQENLDLCDYVVKIPMYNDVDSLNVAAASAVAFWELRK